MKYLFGLTAVRDGWRSVFYFQFFSHIFPQIFLPIKIKVLTFVANYAKRPEHYDAPLQGKTVYINL
jgi:hypothetical protein